MVDGKISNIRQCRLRPYLFDSHADRQRQSHIKARCLPSPLSCMLLMPPRQDSYLTCSRPSGGPADFSVGGDGTAIPGVVVCEVGAKEDEMSH